MWYEINVVSNGVHLFATHKRSITSERILKAMWVLFKEKFPESEGFSLAATQYEVTGRAIPLEPNDDQS